VDAFKRFAMKGRLYKGALFMPVVAAIGYQAFAE
jgi:hypothetical protein